jgi:segregation and condensation protein B
VAEDQLKYAVEALLFASEKPLSAEEIRQAFEPGITVADVREAIYTLKADYDAQGRGFRLFEIAEGFQLMTDPRFADYLKRFYTSREKKRVSPASLETLAVIAYKQPVTKADIEFIRGVNVDGPMKTLLEKSLIKITGKKEVPGHPFLYGTTKEFLDHFGLKSIQDLPPLKEFTEKDIADHLLPPEMKMSSGAEALAEAEAAAEQSDGQVGQNRLEQPTEQKENA